MVLMATHRSALYKNTAQAYNASVRPSYYLYSSRSPLENLRAKNKLHNITTKYPTGRASLMAAHTSHIATSLKTDENLLNMSQTRKKKNG